MQVSDASSDAMIAFSGEQIASDMAYIVENDVLVHSVLQQLKAVGENVNVQNGARIEAVRLAPGPNGRGMVQLKSGQSFSCDLLVSPIHLFYMSSQSFELETLHLL